jgi:hypothetical protein
MVAAPYVLAAAPDTAAVAGRTRLLEPLAQQLTNPGVLQDDLSSGARTLDSNVRTSDTEDYDVRLSDNMDVFLHRALSCAQRPVGWLSPDPRMGNLPTADLIPRATTGPFTNHETLLREGPYPASLLSTPKGLDRRARDRQMSSVMRRQEPGGEWF